LLEQRLEQGLVATCLHPDPLAHEVCTVRIGVLSASEAMANGFF